MTGILMSAEDKVDFVRGQLLQCVNAVRGLDDMGIGEYASLQS